MNNRFVLSELLLDMLDSWRDLSAEDMAGAMAAELDEMGVVVPDVEDDDFGPDLSIDIEDAPAARVLH